MALIDIVREQTVEYRATLQNSISDHYETVREELAARAQALQDRLLVDGKAEIMKILQSTAPQYIKQVNDALDSKIDEISEESLEPLQIEIPIMYDADMVEVILPVTKKEIVDGNSLYSDIFDYVDRCMKSQAMAPKIETNGRYITLRGERADTVKSLSAQLKENSEALKNAALSLNPLEIPINSYRAQGETFRVPLTESDLKFGIIRVNKDQQRYWPVGDNDHYFLVQSTVGTAKSHVTSRRQGEQEAGKYVCKELKPIFRDLDLKDGDQLVIRVDDLHSHYTIESVRRSRKRK